jgi:hypothetical protein
MNQVISTVSGSLVKAARRSLGLARSKRFTTPSGRATGIGLVPPTGLRSS